MSKRVAAFHAARELISETDKSFITAQEVRSRMDMDVEEWTVLRALHDLEENGFLEHEKHAKHWQIADSENKVN